MTNGRYWSSSPDVDIVAWAFYISDELVTQNGDDDRDYYDRVRCLKDTTSA